MQLFPENLTINGTVNNDRISHRTMVRMVSSRTRDRTGFWKIASNQKIQGKQINESLKKEQEK